MPANPPEQPLPPVPATRPAERPGLTIKGGWVVAATLSLFLIIPAIVVVIALATKSEPVADQPFDWAERQTWSRTFYTTYKSLERGMMSSARTNETYKDLGFHIEPDHQLAVMRCTALAKQSPPQFFNDATRQKLEAEIEALPDLFYAHFLLATWHQGHNDPFTAEKHLERAFAAAPAALMQHYVTPEGPSATSTAVPTLAFAADQIINDQLDRSVVLVFPHLTTDDEGFIYLPVYKAILRAEDPALPPGVPDLREKYQWFTFVGRIGRLPDETLPTAGTAGSP